MLFYTFLGLILTAAGVVSFSPSNIGSVRHIYLLPRANPFKNSQSTCLHNWNDDVDQIICNSSTNDVVLDRKRSLVWRKTAVQGLSLLTAGTVLSVWARRASASSASRTDGYAVQKTDNEWKQQLSQMQYFILRQGGTEQPGYSILESETRPGICKCAGCGTPLFDTSSKFKSGTGWPSFASALEGVEVEQVDPITASLSGAELRCKTCGGHLGDVFNDGFLFIGTVAAKTGKRYCIDGAALIFYPEGDETNFLRGDVSVKSKNSERNWLDPPKIIPRSRE
jgi:peptide-methionine (R)-S-oxide reductase